MYFPFCLISFIQKNNFFPQKLPRRKSQIKLKKGAEEKKKEERDDRNVFTERN